MDSKHALAMPEETTTAVFLTPEEALAFVLFQKRYAFMQLLESVDAFAIKSGSLTIHFDRLGAIASLDIQRHYKT